ncbi:hypothetical protein BDZ89DRAFT_1161846 [Hymenopellis radicata]|nr:hypothetical protein BDZ89DRAFT_1161846 [Hymenopellis radicata]
MLTLHPSSTCDICYDLYKGAPGTPHAPHSIPCGHVFCKECLTSVVPRLCPFCRHPFAVQTIRKLHLGAPEPSDKDREMELIRKLLQAMDESDVGHFIADEEVAEWLCGGKDGTILPRVVKVVEECDRLSVQHRRDKTRIQALEYASRRLAQIADSCDVHELQALQEEVDRGRIRIANLENEIAQARMALFRAPVRTVDPALEKDSISCIRRREERDVAFESVIRALALRKV